MPTCSKCKKDLDDSSFIGKNGKPVKQCAPCRDRNAAYDADPERKEKKKETAAARAQNTDVSKIEFPCTGCPRKNLKAEDFIGRGGSVVKTCTHCRAKSARLDAKPERREEKNARARASGHAHSKKYREKKRAENEDEYLRHNAAIHRAWYEKNKDKVSKWSASNMERKLSAAKASAEKKELEWDIDDDFAKDLMAMPCFYCDCKPSDETHGITRLDTTQDFTEDNCVPSCTSCTAMKKSLDAQTFIERCRHISARFGGLGEDHANILGDTISASMDQYMQRAEHIAVEFAISMDEFQALISKACHYCGKETMADKHVNGVDRKDNSAGYTLENCVSCCGNCNFSKGDLNADEFVDKCKLIAGVEHDDVKIVTRCMGLMG